MSDTNDLFGSVPATTTPSLNPEQQRAAEHVEGPLLVLAGAGSGKTRVLTGRIARLIEDHGVPPERILAVTFTNKAAGEMRDRVRALLGRDPVGAWIGTFHSIGARLLRRHAHLVGWDSTFTIFDAEESLREIKRVLRELELDPKKWKPKAVRAALSDAKNLLVTPGEFVEEHGDGFDFFLRNVAKVYPRYQERLAEQNAFDFDDLLVQPVRLFEEHEHVLARYRERFAFILVDEYQDTNRAQFRFLELLARGHGNLMVVGDDDQCVVAGTEVSVEEGTRPVEDVLRGESVRGAAGRGETALSPATPHPPRLYRGHVVRVTTEGGRALTATPNHLVFGRLVVDPELWYVYLMQRDDTGFRIGVTRGVRARRAGDLVNGLAVRLNQERADRLWVLATAASSGEARYLEARLSLTSGVPTARFHAEAGPEDEEGMPATPAVWTRDRIRALQKELGVTDRAEDLLADLLLFRRYPHHEAGAVVRGERVRRRVLFTLFGDSRRYAGRPWADHRIQLVTSGGSLEDAVTDAGFPVRKGRRSTWRVETARKDHDRGWGYSRRLAAEIDGEVRVRARLGNPAGDPGGRGVFDLLPISHLYPGMEVAALDEDGILRPDRIASRSVERYEGPVHDLSVDDLRTYVAGGICGHNSIYGWRGADLSNILDFERTFPGAKVVRLERNYRSTSTILQAANEVIRRNLHRKEKTLRTDRDPGERITLVETADERDEAGWIAEEIETRMREGDADRYRDFAILYRTNAQSRALEDSFRRRGLPYQIVGGVRFYERREIQDVLAYLRLISNPADSAAFARVVNVPKRGVGRTSQERLAAWAAAEGLSLLEAAVRAEEVPGLHKGGVKGIRRFAELVQRFSARAASLSVGPLLEELIEELGFLQDLRDEGPEGEDRAENVKELIAGALDFDSERVEQWGEEGPPDHFTELDLFLQHVALVTDIDRHDPDSDAVTLMTLHNAKGLEFPVVFIAGLEEGLFPLGRAYEEPAQLEEERRLFYVGITRAMHKLLFTWARERRRAGDFMFGSLSSFAEDVPEGLVEERRTPRLEREVAARAAQRPSRGRGSSEDGFGSSASRAAARQAREEREFEESMNQDLPRLVKGERVSHATFGAGTVQDVSGFGRDIRVTVDFDSVGPKKLLARYAGLEREL